MPVCKHSTWTTSTPARMAVAMSNPQRRPGLRSRASSNPTSTTLNAASNSGIEDEAFQVCSGIVAGLYRAEQSGFELYEYAEDAPSELAGRAVDIWRRRRRNCAFPRQFVKTFTPDWDWLAD